MNGGNLEYCPACGSELTSEFVEGRSRRFCRACEEPVYRNPKPCAGVLVVSKRDQLLLVERTEPPAPGTWSVPAGYLEADEPPRAAAVRELEEETGVAADPDGIELFDTAFVRHPDGRYVLVVIYLMPASETEGTVAPGYDAADARFWDLEVLASSDEEEVEAGYRDIFEAAVEAVSRPD